MPFHYAYIPPPPYVPNQTWGMPLYPFRIPHYPAWGAPHSSVFDRVAHPAQDRLSAPQFGHQQQVQKDYRTVRSQRPTNPAGGHISTASKRTTKGDVVKICITDVVIQENKEGTMICGESNNTRKKRRYDYKQNSRSKIVHAPMVPIRINTIVKAKIASPKSEREPGKRGGKNI
jgi:hypothetical protein